MLLEPFYDPLKSYEENFSVVPFGAFNEREVIKNETKSKFNFFGFELNSPFGIPAGPLINGKFAQAALDKGFDIATYKTVRSAKYACYPLPNVVAVKVEGGLTANFDKLTVKKSFHEPLSITNSFGVPSFDPEFWQEDIKKVLKNIRKGQMLIGSFQGTKKEGQTGKEYINDFVLTAGLLKETGVKVMEVNLSCPNEGTNNLLCHDRERSLVVVKAIKKEIGNIPLIIKISYYKDERALHDFIKEIGPYVEGISAINTISAEIVDENGNQALPGEGRLSSGICGHAI